MSYPSRQSFLLTIRREEQSHVFALSGEVSPITSIQDVDEEFMELLITLYHEKELPETRPDLRADIEERILSFTRSGFEAAQMSALLRGLGAFMYDKMLPAEIKLGLETLPESSLLTLDLDEKLAAIPLELAFDGRNFLCLKFACGRGTGSGDKHIPKKGKEGLKLLIVADPTGDLPGTQNETNYIIEQLRGFPRLRIVRLGTEITKQRFLDFFAGGEYDILHYTGHSRSHASEPKKSQLVFRDGPCYAHEIEKSSPKYPPRFVFGNSCQSAGISGSIHETGLQSLAGSFLRTGVRGCVAAIWPVSDVGSAALASDFYRFILYGSTAGEALLKARLSSFREWGYHDPVWASFILYGDPTAKLL